VIGGKRLFEFFDFGLAPGEYGRGGRKLVTKGDAAERRRFVNMDLPGDVDVPRGLGILNRIRPRCCGRELGG
jgi:hypothetical protein